MAPYQNFLAAIYNYKLVTGLPAELLALALPWAEFILGIFLLLGLWTRLSATALWVINSVFIGVIVSALSRKLLIDDCGCFGSGSLPLPKVLMLDIALWLGFAVLFFFARDASAWGMDRFFNNLPLPDPVPKPSKGTR